MGAQTAAPAVREIYEGIFGIGREARRAARRQARVDELPVFAPDGTVISE